MSETRTHGDAADATASETANPSAAERLKAAAEILEAASKNRALLATLTEAERTRLLTAAGEIYCPDLNARRRLVKAKIRQRKNERSTRDQDRLEQTGIRAKRRERVFTSPNVFPPTGDPPGAEAASPSERELLEPRNCYICKADYGVLHGFYDQLCPACAEFNFQKRTELADLRGRVALLTGGRVKIGYQAGLKLLRAGAHLVVTTRFPRDAAARYAAEPDFASWSDRLEIFGLDLRHPGGVEAFCAHFLAARARLDFMVHNACQTVRRPPDFYQHLLARERAIDLPSATRPLLRAYEVLRNSQKPSASDISLLSEIGGLTGAPELSQLPLLKDEWAPRRDLFPEGKLDADSQQIDLRAVNSWRFTLTDVPSVELLEVHLVNAMAPFIFNARLKPLMARTPNRDKHIVNVSAVEGQFYRKFKTTRHPHTNMAKAALNMMTRTSAADYHADGIHMNSVDTGWVTDEDPAATAERKRRDHQFHPPLDIVDGAARIVDPIIAGINTGCHVWGRFLKDYRPTDW